MSASFKITGLDRLQKHISQMQNPRQVFDDDFKRNALESSKQLISETNKRTGTTARGWSRPRKENLSRYIVVNEVKTGDKKYSLVTILDQGRREITPVSAKRLYIPLSQKGMSKKTGAPIPKGFVYGIDYVFAKSSRAVVGTKFISKEGKRCSIQLTKDMISTIRRVHSGQ